MFFKYILNIENNLLEKKEFLYNNRYRLEIKDYK